MVTFTKYVMRFQQYVCITSPMYLFYRLLNDATNFPDHIVIYGRIISNKVLEMTGSDHGHDLI